MTKKIDKTGAVADFKRIVRDWEYCHSKTTRIANMLASRFKAALDEGSVEDLYDMIQKTDLMTDDLRAIRGMLKPIALQRLEDEEGDNETIMGSHWNERCEILSTGKSQG